MAALLSDISVNGRIIPADAIAAEAQNHPAPKGKPGKAWVAAARALALRELLLQEACARGLAPDPWPVAPGKVETEAESLIRQLMDRAVAPEPVTEADLRALYDAAPDRFRAPALFEAAHILIPAAPEDTAAREAAHRLAAALIRELGANPGRFAALAAEHSACGSRSSGGQLGQITAGDTVPEFESVLRELPEGTIAPEPVASRFGVHVVRLDARAAGAVLPYPTVAPRLRAAAEKAAWVRAARAFAEALAARAEVRGVTLGAS